MFRKINLALVLTMGLFFQAIAQQNTNSPYTRFGFGELVDAIPGDQKAMGGVSIATRNPISINSMNPASYSSIDSMTFMFDVGMTGLASQFTDPSGSARSFTSNLEYITMEFPLAKNLGFSAGVIPFSFGGYNFSNQDSVSLNGNLSDPTYVSFTRQYYGAGGISQIYAGLGWKFLNHFSAGINAYYMFGKGYNVRSLSFSNASYNQSIQSNVLDVKNFRLRYGLQYFDNFNKNDNFAVGLIFEPGAALNGSFSQITVGNPSDTIVYDDEFDMPMTFGVGLNYQMGNKMTVAADYMRENWGDARFFGRTDSLQNRYKMSVGLEYVPNYRGQKYFDRVKYRLGFKMNNPYYKVNGASPATNFGLTCGLGLPLATSKSELNLALEYGKIGSTAMFREDYLKLSLNVTFNEMWFFKRKL